MDETMEVPVDADETVMHDLVHDMDTEGQTSDIDTTLTSFEEILKPEKEEERTGSGPSKTNAAADMLYTAPACFMEYSDTACLHGHQRAQDAQLKVSQCAEDARDRVHEYLREFFSPEQEKARTIMVKRAVSKIRQGLHACHDTVDLLLVRVFEQPLQEVEVRKTLDQTGSMSFNEDITIDSELKRPEGDDSTHRKLRRSDEAKKEKLTRRARLASKKEKGKKAKRSKKQTPNTEVDQQEPVVVTPTPDLEESSPGTDSDVESLTRFKDLLYGRKRDIDEAKQRDVLSDLLQEKEESRSELDTPSSTSMDELDRALRTDIEKLGRIAGLSRSSVAIEPSLSDVWHITASSSTPLRCNRRLDSDSEYVDFSQINLASKMEPTVLTEPLPIENSTALLSLHVHQERSAPLDEEVIDLTMYDESFDKATSGIEFVQSRTQWQWR